MSSLKDKILNRLAQENFVTFSNITDAVIEITSLPVIDTTAETYTQTSKNRYLVDAEENVIVCSV